MSGNALTSYYSNRIYDSVGIDNNDTRFGLNGGRSILDLIVTVSCALLVDRIGRRPLFLAATGGMLLFFAGMTVLGNRYTATPTTGIGIGFVTFQWLHGVSYALAWSGLLVAVCHPILYYYDVLADALKQYTVEILPFKLRAKGLMIMNVSVQAALAFSGQVNPIPMDGAWNGQEWKLYTVYTCWIAFELVIVYMFYVETRYVLNLDTLCSLAIVKLTMVAQRPNSRGNRQDLRRQECRSSQHQDRHCGPVGRPDEQQ